MKTIKRDEVLAYINDDICKSRVADSYKELKLFCKVEGINATKQKIKTYLLNKAKEDGVNLHIINEPSIVDLLNTDENLIKRSADKLMQDIAVSKYKFNRADLQYFNDLFRIYTTKCLKICNIISMIVSKHVLDRDLMEELDITITAEEVLLSDIERLLVPLKHNYALALATKFRAEQMDTYLKLNIDRVALDKVGAHFSECLPNEDLQDYFGLSSDKKQFVTLTEKQKKAIEEQTLENFSHYLMEDIDN